MTSSFLRIAEAGAFEHAIDMDETDSLGPPVVDGDVFGEVRDLVRLARVDPNSRASGYGDLQRILAKPPGSLCRHIISFQQSNAGAVLDLLQEWLDWAPPNHPDRRRAIYLLVRLSIGSKQLPRLLYVSNIRIGNRDPWRTGGFADVFKAMHHATAVVLKRLRVHCTEESDPELDQKFRREALIWRQLKHPFILPLIGIDSTTFGETDFLPCLVSPMMRRGTLRDYLRSDDYSPLYDFHRLLEEVAQGVLYLHSQKIVHGDIKDVNILIDFESHVQLCDFGLVVVGDATDARLTTTTHGTGTAAWMSPQRLKATRYRITEADDVYAYACLSYYLCTGHAPFHELSPTAVIFRIVGGDRPSRPTEGVNCDLLVTDKFWAMVLACWAHDPAERPTAAGIVSGIAAIRNIAEDEENPSMLLLHRRARAGPEPYNKPPRKRTRVLELEVPSDQEPPRSLEIDAVPAGPAFDSPETGALSVLAAFEKSWWARTDARVRHIYLRSRAGLVTRCAWHRQNWNQSLQVSDRQITVGFLSCGCTYEEALFEESLVRNGVCAALPGESLFWDAHWDPELRNALLGLLQERYGYRDGDFDHNPETSTWNEGEGPLQWEQRQLCTQAEHTTDGPKLSFVGEWRMANTPAVPPSFEADWRARTEARMRQFCHLNSTCAWHAGGEKPATRKWDFSAYPPRAAPTGCLTCGCTHEEALFEESLARNGVGAYPSLTGDLLGTKMKPELRNPLLLLMQRRFGYRDGEFERDASTGEWKEGEGPLYWQQRALLVDS